MDPYPLFVLSSAAIVWSLVGLMILVDIFPTPSCTFIWKAFLTPFAGPAAWGILIYRGFRHVRHLILHHYGLPECGCCSHH